MCNPATGVCGYAPKPANTYCGGNQVCDGAGKCVGTLVSTWVHCGSGTKTADQLCQDNGFAGATTAHGYWWGQCSGSLTTCPGGWQGDGTVCPDWCPATDCGGLGYCSNPYGWSVKERAGDGSTDFTANEYWSCPGWNPGWTVRMLCHY